MTEFVTPTLQADGNIIDQLDWNNDIAYNLIALHERAPVGYPHKQVANTTTETELFSATIPANSLGTKGFLVCEVFAVMQNNSGATRAPNLRFKIGAAQVLGFGPNVAAGANRQTARWRFAMQNLNNYAQQLSVLEVAYLSAQVPAGTLGSASLAQFWKDTVFDTSIDQTFSVTWQWDAAAVSCVFDPLAMTLLGPISKT